MNNQQLIKLLIELSERLADESDYDDYLFPKMASAVDYLEDQE